MSTKTMAPNLPGTYVRARKEPAMVRRLQYWSGHETRDIDELMTLPLMSAMPTIQLRQKAGRPELAAKLAVDMKTSCGEDPAGELRRAVDVL